MIPDSSPRFHEDANAKARDELIAGLTGGEETAWRDFLNQYAALVVEVARKTGLGEDECEDVLQQVCVVVLRSVGALRDASKLSTWVYGIAYRQAVDVWRLRAKLPRQEGSGDLSALDQLTDPAPAAVDELLALEDTAHLYDALSHLDPRCQRLLRALYLEYPQPSYEAIAEREGMPIGSIGPTRARCLKKLREWYHEAGSPRLTSERRTVAPCTEERGRG